MLSVNLDDSADIEKVRSLHSRNGIFHFPSSCGTDGYGRHLQHSLWLPVRPPSRSLASHFIPHQRQWRDRQGLSGAGEPDHVEYDFRHIPQNNAERMARALPFPGVTDAIEFGRNYLSYGSVFFQRGYLDQAKASFQIASRDDPESAEALYGIGSVYLDQKRPAKPAIVSNAPSNSAPVIPTRWQTPGTISACWRPAGPWRRSDRIFSGSSQAESRSLIALNNLGSAYRQQKRWDDARKTYERAFQFSPNNAEANYGLAMVFAQNDDTARAFDSCRGR